MHYEINIFKYDRSQIVQILLVVNKIEPAGNISATVSGNLTFEIALHAEFRL